MTFINLLLASLVAVICGLDRTAAFQLMLSRPIVAGPLTGLVLGEPLIGLQAGMLVELLWLGRLPVGASIPPDDTQIAIGGTVLSIAFASPDFTTPVTIVFCLCIAIPLAKSGQFFDRMARQANNHTVKQLEQNILTGDLSSINRLHLVGIGHFALASLFTFVFVVGAGSILCSISIPYFMPFLVVPINWLQLVFILVGASTILSSINVNRATTLFGASFVSSILMLWLL
jgi:PTS system mannose-specific IIC component